MFIILLLGVGFVLGVCWWEEVWRKEILVEFVIEKEDCGLMKKSLGY